MSEPVRIALVAEGPTDRVVIRCAVEAMLGDRPFVLRQVQPEESAAFGAAGTGWVGVYRWGKQAVERAQGKLRDDPLFREYHLLIVHLDADVAEKSYADGGISGEPKDLPCAFPCPPPSATTNPLRQVLLRWMGESAIPEQVVLCTPSKSTEAWVLAAIFPMDRAVPVIECHPDAEGRLSVQKSAVRLRKKPREYETVGGRLIEAWPNLAENLREAARFNADFVAAIESIPE